MSTKPKQPVSQPQTFKTQAIPEYSVTAACLNCKAPIHGEWIGEPERQTLECPACGQLHIVDIEEKPTAKPATTKQPVSQPKPPFSEDMMRLALSRLATVAPLIQGNADDDDPVAILQGAIDELLHKRQSIASVQLFMQQWLQEQTRR